MGLLQYGDVIECVDETFNSDGNWAKLSEVICNGICLMHLANIQILYLLRFIRGCGISRTITFFCQTTVATTRKRSTSIFSSGLQYSDRLWGLSQQLPAYYQVKIDIHFQTSFHAHN